MRNEYDRDSLTYEGVGTGKRWERIESYGPKIVENLTQALCRDLLAEAMQRLSNTGYKIVMHVHDEVVIEAPMDTDVDTVCKIMSQTPSWATGLILNAAGYECMFYQKD
jgi:DNA polymerase